MPTRLLIAACVFTILSLSAPLALALPDQYSAEQLITANGQTIIGKIYRDQGKSRIEMNLGGMNTVTIIQQDLHLAYQLIPGNLYIEMPLEGGATSMGMGGFNDAQVAALAEAANLVGPEDLNGMACDKYRYHPGQPDEGFVWIAKDTLMPVKLESSGKSSGFEIKNIRIGPQRLELFEVPADYTKMDGAGIAPLVPMGATVP